MDPTRKSMKPTPHRPARDAEQVQVECELCSLRNALALAKAELGRAEERERTLLDTVQNIGDMACPQRDPANFIGGTVLASDRQFDAIRMRVVQVLRLHDRDFFNRLESPNAKTI